MEDEEEIIIEESGEKESKKGRKVKSYEAIEPKNPSLTWYSQYTLPVLRSIHLSLENAYTSQLNTWEIDGMTKERCDYLQGFYERLISIRIILKTKEEQIVKENVAVQEK